jgi:hypothetical protein
VPVNGLAISPDQLLFVTAGSDGMLRFFPLLLDIEDMLSLAGTRIAR